MPLSTLPEDGPELPAGCNKVTNKDIDVAQVTPKEDVTSLDDEERVYADPPLVESEANTATATCQASGTLRDDTVLDVTSVDIRTGWICESAERTREAGKYATWAASYSYYPEEGS